MTFRRGIAFVLAGLLLPAFANAQVTGSGTNRYLSKWNSSSSINNAGIYQVTDFSGNGEYFGLNTTNPDGVLAIQCRNGYEIFGTDTTGTGWNLDIASTYNLQATAGIKRDGTVHNAPAALKLGGGGVVGGLILEKKKATFSTDIGVGLGATPDTNFSTGFRLKVCGNIKTKGLTTDASGWCDYAFRPNYPLMPLPELEASIAREGHLPGIPTESDVMRDGVNIGQMTEKLLLKVEELTLYVIDLKKQNDALKAEVARPDRR